jgi:hemin uptake protein HemP
MNPPPNSPAPPVPAAPTPSSFALPCVDSHALLAGARELLIRHGDELYRLRHTRSDKLILVK